MAPCSAGRAAEPARARGSVLTVTSSTRAPWPAEVAVGLRPARAPVPGNVVTGGIEEGHHHHLSTKLPSEEACPYWSTSLKPGACARAQALEAHERGGSAGNWATARATGAGAVTGPVDSGGG